MLNDDLAWFITLAETEHMTEAARLHNMSQPALSRALDRLERRLGTRLFDRHGKRLALNQRGRVLYTHARRAVAEMDAAVRKIEDMVAAPSLVRLGFLHSFGMWLVPKLVSGYREEHPSVNFELTQDAADKVCKQIVDEELDLGIVAPRPNDPRLAWQPLLRQKLCLAVPAGHRLAERDSVSLVDASREPFVLMTQGHGMRRLVEELAAAAGFQPKISFESTELWTIRGLVASGLGVALIPLEDEEASGPQAGNVVVLPLEDAGAEREVGLVFKSGMASSGLVQDFKQYSLQWAFGRRSRI
ncbi:MAG: LysR family transcriptional regulator [Segniliparus sp.]|uniref:LysR family transcriptional regulator n=1 Tax=Segniliparus sp. TaxID=2804064 RepID=UPI003F2A87AD